MGVISCGTTMLDAGEFQGLDVLSWDTTAKTASFTGVAGNGYFVNTTSTAITLTLPASPSAGDQVGVKDYAGTFGTNNLIVNRNGSNFGGGSDANTINYSTSGSSLLFIYVDATQGWLVIQDSSNTDTMAEKFITATGGSITTSGDYKIHTFTGPGTFTVTCAGNAVGSNAVDYQVVAGGGGGASGSNNEGGGGGGAGGYRETAGCGYTSSPLGTGVSQVPVSVQGYPITVGAGGAGAAGGPPNPAGACEGGNDGSNSVFSSIISAGGGGGGSADGASSSRSGGSGGGGGTYGKVGAAGNTPPVSPPQGNPGGNGGGGPPSFSGGGGGGASAAGAAGTPSSSGNGGAGATTNISASPVTKGGGGGGGSDNAPGGTGGPGGGGNGGSSTAGSAGSANTGGGGGSGGGPNTNRGGDGGSGIVIIRYKFQ